MDRYLRNGSQIKNPARSGVYEIRNIVGTGASCVVYLADFFESSGIRTEHLLKEYNPKGIRIDRDEQGNLCVCAEKDQAAFETGLKRFEAGYQMQLNVRRCSDMKNSTSNIQSIFTANGTRYIDMTVMEGRTYNQIQERSLYDLLRRIKTITEVVASYHKNGLLHLDIKPENIFVFRETVEMVQIFDFDSVTLKADAARSAFLSYTQSWAAQEQILPNRRHRICDATDLFAVGEILFYKLMGRHSESHERRSFSSYHFDHSADIFEGVNPRAFVLLEDIFRHTICSKCADRYQTAPELLEKLTAAIKLADPKEPFLHHHLPSKAAYFVGREAEMQEIEERLKQTDKLFISGMGGMGKSELVKQYAHVHRDEYDAVIFAICNTDLESMILDDSMLPIGNVQQDPDEKAQGYYRRKRKALEKLCNKHILIIVDNFNDLQDSALDALLQLNCKMLFTTRCDAKEYNYEQMFLGTMAAEYVWDIFCTWNERQLVDEERRYVRQIIDLYQGHTMAVELIAKQMKASRISPKQMLDKLNTGGFQAGGRERMVHVKDGMQPKLNIHDHIRRLFDISKLSDDCVYILANLSLMPPSGVSAQQFHDWCQLDGYQDINDMAESGWLRQNTEADTISLHPVIADVMFDILIGNISFCKNLLLSIVLLLESDAFGFSDFHFRNMLYGVVKNIIVRANSLNDDSCTFSRFINAAALNYHQYGMIDVLIQMLTNTISNYALKISTCDENIADFYNTLGLLYQSSGQFKKAEEALDIWISKNGKYHITTAKAYNNLGNLYLAIKAWDAAEANLNKSQDIIHQLYGETHNLAATIYLNLGHLYRQKKDLKKAHDSLSKSLSISVAVNGEEHRSTARAYNELGLLNNELNDQNTAIILLKKALDIEIHLYGEYHNEIATTCINLGLVYCSLKQYKDAEELYLKAKNILLDTYGEKHTSLAILYYNFGALYNAWGLLVQAKENYLRSLLIRQDLFGSKSKHIIDSLVCMGVICKKLGHLEEAENYYLTALEIRQEIFGEKHYYTALSHFNLGILYREMGCLDQSVASHQKALSIRLLIHEANHKDIASSYSHLGFLYYSMGNYREALSNYCSAMEIYNKVEGTFDAHVSSLFRYIGILHREMKVYDKALINLERALEKTRQVYGDTHDYTAAVYSALGKTHAELKNSSLASYYYQKSLAIRLELFEPHHPSIQLLYERIQELHEIKN